MIGAYRFKTETFLVSNFDTGTDTFILGLTSLVAKRETGTEIAAKGTLVANCVSHLNCALLRLANCIDSSYLLSLTAARHGIL